MENEDNPKDEVYRCQKEPKSKYFYLCKEDHDKRCKRCSNNSTECSHIELKYHGRIDAETGWYWCVECGTRFKVRDDGR